jgi:CHAD domain-containing protein
MIYGPLFGGELERWISRKAKRITKLPTKVRDLDVAVENLAALGRTARSAGERRAADDLGRRLEKERDRRSRKLRRRLRRDQPAAALAAVLRKALRRRAAPLDDVAAVAPRLLEGCARAVEDRRAEVGGWRDEKELHRLRVALKKYRGVLSAYSALQQHPQHDEVLALLKEAQQVLGEHHDWSELGRRLRDRAAELAAKADQGPRRRALLAGYLALHARVEQEQRGLYDTYRRRLHDRIPALVHAPPAPTPTTRVPALRSWN